MRRFHLCAVAIAVALGLGPAAHAQGAPAGWKAQATPGAWTATSPEQVRLVFYPAVKSKSTFVYWFEDEGLRRTYSFGRNIRSQEKSERTMDPSAGSLLAQSRTLEDASGARTAVLSYAWETPKGRQLVQIVLPYAVGQKSPAYAAAMDQLTAAWKGRIAYTPPEKARD